eukprot:jgi/Mesen1/7624/ME000004S07896
MAALRAVVATSASRTPEEAKGKVMELFRDVCRSLPMLMQQYNLGELITLPELRSTIASAFRKHSRVSNPQVIDMLVYKGQEDFDNYLSQSKQRHHLISQWISNVDGRAPPMPGNVSHVPGIVTHPGESLFLKKFYESNAPL